MRRRITYGALEHAVGIAVTFVTIGLIIILPGFAQSTGQCDVGIPGGDRPASADLDVANVRARLFLNGAVGWMGGEPVYEVPKGSDIDAIFTSAPWIGGVVDGELRISAATYTDWEMWPGPLDLNGDPPTDCTLYNRIFSVSDDDIRHYNATGEHTPDMIDWPWNLGAPVFESFACTSTTAQQEPSTVTLRQ